MRHKSDDLLRQIKQLRQDLRSLRPLSESNKNGSIPVSIIHAPIDPMAFEVGKITETPWPGVSCFGVRMSEEEVVVICDVKMPIRMDPHEHGPWSESLVMMDGYLYEHASARRFGVGDHYFQPANRIHEPEFLTPARCAITWRR